MMKRTFFRSFLVTAAIVFSLSMTGCVIVPRKPKAPPPPPPPKEKKHKKKKKAPPPPPKNKSKKPAPPPKQSKYSYEINYNGVTYELD